MAAKKKTASKVKNSTSRKKTPAKKAKKVASAKAKPKAVKKRAVTKKKVAEKTKKSPAKAKKVASAKAKPKAVKKRAVTKKKVAEKTKKSPAKAKKAASAKTKPKAVKKKTASKAPIAKPKKRRRKKLSVRAAKKFKDMLLTVREQLSHQIEYLRGDSLTIADSVYSPEDGTDAFERQLALKLAGSEGDSLFEIDEALRRLNDGTYGVCEDCEDLIEEARLKALPFARRCIKCKTYLEGHGYGANGRSSSF